MQRCLEETPAHSESFRHSTAHIPCVGISEQSPSWVRLMHCAPGKDEHALCSLQGRVQVPHAVAAYEKSLIESALHDTKGDRTRAAELLGLSRSSLYRKAEQLSIVLPQEKKVSP